MRRLAAFVLAVLLAALAACGGEEAVQEPPPPVVPQETAGQEDTLPRGGTLRVGLVRWAQDELGLTSPDGKAHYALDPQVEYRNAPWELFRCCLLRTLLSYNGKPTAEGGAELRPDLAADMPTVSADGLTWTFRLKPGLRYAPPFEDTEIVAGDVIRAVERVFAPLNASMAEQIGYPQLGPYSFYYSPLIEGAEAFEDGEAGSISGLEAPDAHTLVVHLTEPAGDLGYRFALPAAAPIPPGATDGRDDGYGAFLVASGPYLIERYVPGEAITLVRNPSWNRASDSLRTAYADRIELTIGLDAETGYRMVDSGAFDLVLDEPAPAEVVQRYEADAALKDRLVVLRHDSVIYGAMNLAAPPFDDVHVRRAANLVVDKSRLVERMGGPAVARVASHLAPDALTANLLLDYAPHATPGNHGDLEAAMAEMRESGYDQNRDGICDHAACSSIATIALADGHPAEVLIAPLQEDLARLGLDLEVERLPRNRLYDRLTTQSQRQAFVLATAWFTDFPNGSGWFPATLSGANGPATNSSLVGHSPEELEAWGYPVTSVPGVEEELAECVALVGGAQTQCWAQLDQLVMEQIAPWIPYSSDNTTLTVSERVASISIDQWTTLPSLDRIALEPGS